MVVSTAYTAPDGKTIELHWIENLKTGLRYEHKSIHDLDWKNALKQNKRDL